jgi:CheY-like chemotaxis protein
VRGSRNRRIEMKPQSKGKGYILVVEDDEDFAALVSFVLRAQGYDVATAGDGDVAMAAVRDRRPDLITLDILMPGETGIMFYRQLKSRTSSFQGIPVVVVSGVFQHDREKLGLIRPFFETERLPPPVDYLEKPLDAARLAEVVAGALRPELAS